MPRLAWLTDLHLNFADGPARRGLEDELQASQPDHLLIGGDIAESATFVESLEWLAGESGRPVWFVLGNHDYYKGSIADIRRQARELSERSENVSWLPISGVVRLNEETALIGHGGWGDARAGNFLGSNVVLNDYLLIEELRTKECTAAVERNICPDIGQILNLTLRERLHSLGDEAAAHLRTAAIDALAVCHHVLVLMHVPPFREACWHNGRLSDDNWAPHFVCAAAGEALREVMAAHPEGTMSVLCGHTHSSGRAEILPNLNVLTGKARYGRPVTQRMLQVGPSGIMNC